MFRCNCMTTTQGGTVLNGHLISPNEPGAEAEFTHNCKDKRVSLCLIKGQVVITSFKVSEATPASSGDMTLRRFLNSHLSWRLAELGHSSEPLSLAGASHRRCLQRLHPADVWAPRRLACRQPSCCHTVPWYTWEIIVANTQTLKSFCCITSISNNPHQCVLYSSTSWC